MPFRFVAHKGDRARYPWWACSATVVIIFILCAVLIGHDLFRTWEDRSRQIENSQREVANLTWAADQHAEAAFRVASASLTAVVERVETDGTGSVQIERLRRVIAQRITDSPVLNAVSVIDKIGTIIVDGGPTTLRTDVANRPYFQHHQTHADRQLWVGMVLRSRMSGNFVIPVSMRISHPDGSFAGVAVASIDTAYFQSFYAALNLGRDGLAALYLDDGILLVRQPILESEIGASSSRIASYHNLLRGALSATFETTPSFDGVIRIASYRRLAGFPLVVIVALGKDEQLAVWRVGALEHLLAAGTIATLLGLIGIGLAVQTRQLARAEQTAITSADQYRLLANTTTDMIVTLDMSFMLTYVSPSCQALLGYAPEALTGTSMADCHPDDIERVVAALHALVAGRDHDRLTYRMRHRNGSWVWAEGTFTLVWTPAYSVALTINGSLRDVGTRMAADIALSESEERLRLLLQSAVVTDAIYMLDINGNVQSWSAAAALIKGYTSSEIVGQNYAVFFTPEDIASGEPAHALATACNSGRFAAEAWMVRKDSSRFLVHMTIDPIYDDAGQLCGFAKATQDITVQRIEEEQRAIIVEAAPNGMMIVDEAGIITLANAKAEQIFDYPHGALVGQPVDVLVPEDFRAAHNVLRTAFTSEQSGQGMMPGQQFTGRKRDGGAVSIEILLRPVKTPHGRIVVASLFDVTDRIRRLAEQQEIETRTRMTVEETNIYLDHIARHLTKARDRAEQASRAKSRFLAGMSHELRTPLNGILGYAHLLHLEGGLNALQGTRVNAMLQAGKHLLEMITCVLDLSEIEADHLVLQPLACDLRVIAAACLDLIRPTAEAKGLALSVVVAPGTPQELVADPMRLRQVLLNLLGNAAKFTRQGTVELRLRTQLDGSMLRIEVADTGPGISAGQRRRLFQDFERLDIETATKVEGAGLGLALSARLATLMGGSLGHDDNPGGGSVFWLELPLNTMAVSPAAIPSLSDALDPTATSVPARVLRILVVDDILMNRDIAGSFLRAAGHEVVCVEGGAQAVAEAAVTDFDVVLMDVRMPGMDGLEATRHIRVLKGTR